MNEWSDPSNLLVGEPISMSFVYNFGHRPFSLWGPNTHHVLVSFPKLYSEPLTYKVGYQTIGLVLVTDLPSASIIAWSLTENAEIMKQLGRNLCHENDH